MSMGGGSGSEGDWKRYLEVLPDPQLVSLSYILEQPDRDLTEAAEYIDMSSASQEAPNALVSDGPIAGTSAPTARARMHRSKTWRDDEKLAMVEAKLEAVRGAGRGKEWEFISRRLERRGFSRSPKECENLWGTLLKKLRAISQHEKSKPPGGQPQTSDPTNTAWVSYFEMDEKSRSSKKFLPLPCYQLMVTILEEQGKRSRSSATADHGAPSYKVVEKADDNVQGFIEQRLELLVAELVEAAVDSSFESLSCEKTCRFSQAEQEYLLSVPASVVKKLVAATVNINLKILASKGYIFDGDDPTAELAPFVEKLIKDAVVNAILPVSSSALEALEQKKLEAQKKRRDVKEKRLALDREEKEIEEFERAKFGGTTKCMRTAQYRGRPRQ